MTDPLPQAASAWVFDRRGRILLVQGDYDLRRWGPPGGAVEPGESPLEAVQREFEEETGATFRPAALIGLYHFVYPSGRLGPWLGYCFAGSAAGTPTVPTTGEIAGLGWFSPDELPGPSTNLLKHVLADACSHARGVARVVEPE